MRRVFAFLASLVLAVASCGCFLLPRMVPFSEVKVGAHAIYLRIPSDGAIVITMNPDPCAKFDSKTEYVLEQWGVVYAAHQYELVLYSSGALHRPTGKPWPVAVRLVEMDNFSLIQFEKTAEAKDTKAFSGNREFMKRCHY